ncbi:hypothetical protein P154DRAFT_358789 [Amniculicola lignicola CBS 123094]|uniref:Uncharacterized protein n=1 Tax=Amniculicola lignicola CBS 123094 TaxID=1392246 RepID=A0A6A5W1Q3_9PLEO|nr:hypothetical protein P154DRAFT_358789 [Amniculicola lignicola CBS 123094]
MPSRSTITTPRHWTFLEAEKMSEMPSEHIYSLPISISAMENCVATGPCIYLCFLVAERTLLWPVIFLLFAIGHGFPPSMFVFLTGIPAPYIRYSFPRPSPESLVSNLPRTAHSHALDV